MANPPFDPYGNPIPANPGAKKVVDGSGNVYPIRSTLKLTSDFTVTDAPDIDETQLNVAGTPATAIDELTGDVTATGPGAAAATIAAASVTLAKMANLAQDQFIGRTTASTGVPQTATITAAARTVLDDTTISAMLTTLGAEPAASFTAAGRSFVGAADVAAETALLNVATTSLKGLLSAADKVKLNGAGELATWRQTYDAMAQALSLTESWYSDCNGDTDLFASSGAGGTIVPQATQGGVLRLATSSAPGGHAEIQSGYSQAAIAARSALVGNPTDNNWVFAVRASVLTLTADTDLRIGLAANLSGAYVGLRIRGTGVMVWEKNGSNTNTTYQPAVDGYHTFAATYNGTTLTAYVDGVSVGTTTAPGVTGGSSMHVELYNSAAASAETADLDKVYCAWA